MKMFVITAVVTTDDTTNSAMIKSWLEDMVDSNGTDKLKYVCVTGILADEEENQTNVDIQHDK